MILMMSRIRCNEKDFTLNFNVKVNFAAIFVHRFSSIQKCRITLRPIRLYELRAFMYIQYSGRLDEKSLFDVKNVILMWIVEILPR